MSPFARTLQIALGAAFVGVAAAVVLDVHSHECPCGARWTHAGAIAGGEESAHRCPACGAHQCLKVGVFATGRRLHNAAVGAR